MSTIQKTIQRMIDRNKNSVIEIASYFHEQSAEDWFIKDKPKQMFIEEIQDIGGSQFILTFYFDNAAFSFSDTDYRFYTDEFKNYISVSSKKHDDYHIVITFQRR